MIWAETSILDPCGCGWTDCVSVASVEVFFDAPNYNSEIACVCHCDACFGVDHDRLSVSSKCPKV